MFFLGFFFQFVLANSALSVNAGTRTFSSKRPSAMCHFLLCRSFEEFAVAFEGVIAASYEPSEDLVGENLSTLHASEMQELYDKYGLVCVCVRVCVRVCVCVCVCGCVWGGGSQESPTAVLPARSSWACCVDSQIDQATMAVALTHTHQRMMWVLRKWVVPTRNLVDLIHLDS